MTGGLVVWLDLVVSVVVAVLLVLAAGVLVQLACWFWDDARQGGDSLPTWERAPERD